MVEAVTLKLDTEALATPEGTAALMYAEQLDAGKLTGTAIPMAMKHLLAILSEMGKPMEEDPAARAQESAGAKLATLKLVAS